MDSSFALGHSLLYVSFLELWRTWRWHTKERQKNRFWDEISGFELNWYECLHCWTRDRKLLSQNKAIKYIFGNIQIHSNNLLFPKMKTSGGASTGVEDKSCAINFHVDYYVKRRREMLEKFHKSIIILFESEYPFFLYTVTKWVTPR